MKIRIKFENQSKLLSVVKTKFKKLSLLDSFDIMSLEVCEPYCPFCGKELKNAQCNCSAYNEAFKKLCLHYEDEQLVVEACYDENSLPSILGFRNIVSLAINKNNIHITEVSQNEITPSLFDNGSIAFYSQENSWYISSGIFENETLTFFVRKKGEDEVYMYEVTNIQHLPPQCSTLLLYTFHHVTVPNSNRLENRLGNYLVRKEKEILDVLSYQEFLQILKRC